MSSRLLYSAKRREAADLDLRSGLGLVESENLMLWLVETSVWLCLGGLVGQSSDLCSESLRICEILCLLEGLLSVHREWRCLTFLESERSAAVVLP